MASGRPVQDGERRVLEMVAAGAPLPEVLTAICRLTDESLPGSVCCVMLLDPVLRRLHSATVPGLPELAEVLEGQPVAEGSGGCGTACVRREPVVVSDIATDPLTAGFRDRLLALGLKACWSKPMLSPRTGEVMGCFAVYRREAPGAPSAAEMEQRDVLLRWAAIAIERWRTEQALKDSEEHLRHTVDLNPQIPWTATPDGQIASVSPRWSKLTGVAQEEALGNGWLRVLHPADHGRMAEVWGQALRTGEPYDIEFRLRVVEGAYRWMRARAYPRRDGNGRILLWYGALEDVHDRRLAEDARRASEERLRLLTDSLPVLIAYVDSDRRYRFVNRAYEDWFGRSLEAIGARSMAEVIGEEAYAARAPRIEAALAGETVRFEGFLPHRDGQPRFTDTQYIPDIGPDGEVRGICVLVVDTTERRRAEEDLRESRERLTTIFNQASVGIVQTDSAERIVLANERACEILGRPVDELLGRHLLDFAHPEDLPPNRDHVVRLFGTGEPFVTERRFLRPDGSSVWVNNRMSLARDAQGRPQYLIGVLLDITERKEAEARQALLAREVDHRAKNMLAVVQAMLRLTKADSREAFIQAIEGRVGALARAHTALSLSRWTGVELRTLVREELEPFQEQGAERVQLHGEAVGIAADATQAIGMALHELATNATKYGALSSPGGLVDVRWRRERGDGSLHLTWQEIGGPPVSPPSREGFGSTVIQQTIGHQLNGEVEQEWRPEGLLCRLRVPAVHLIASAAAEAERPGRAALEERGAAAESLRILVVEDDGLIALEVEHILGELGHRLVGPVTTAQEGLALARTEELDAALLDVSVADGFVFPVAEELSRRGLPFLFVTAYGRDVIPADFAAVPIVRKPFRKQDLRVGLRRLGRSG
ncbi:PAS domain S-box protein [Azospirillum sp. SYSU D00513]|uniref:PAS domain S-box protein n=1 Tax=Azospirillum sp. SYSU D00513 TaxID=2812561 RepID=UPI001A95F529